MTSVVPEREPDLLQYRPAGIGRLESDDRRLQLRDLIVADLGRGDEGHVGQLPASRQHAAAVLLPGAGHPGDRVDHADIVKGVFHRPADGRLIAHGLHLLVCHDDVGVAQHGVGDPPHIRVLVRGHDALALEVGDRLELRILRHDEERLRRLLRHGDRLIAEIANGFRRNIVGPRQQQRILVLLQGILELDAIAHRDHDHLPAHDLLDQLGEFLVLEQGLGGVGIGRPAFVDGQNDSGLRLGRLGRGLLSQGAAPGAKGQKQKRRSGEAQADAALRCRIHCFSFCIRSSALM
jgi:hypothetical protein